MTRPPLTPLNEAGRSLDQFLISARSRHLDYLAAKANGTIDIDLITMNFDDDPDIPSFTITSKDFLALIAERRTNA